jgi:hypothetical protein
LDSDETGFISDSGGGFTCKQKKEALILEQGFCFLWALMANCTCHNIQLTGTLPMQHLFEKGVNGFSLLATTALSWQ